MKKGNLNYIAVKTIEEKKNRLAVLREKYEFFKARKFTKTASEYEALIAEVENAPVGGYVPRFLGEF